MSRNHVETVIIGGGQAGLTAGYHLAKRGRPFVILDANERIGDAWRNRWDSLRLFTPAHFSRLPGKRLDMPNWSFADEGRAGRLPRVLRRALRAAGSERRQGRPAGEGRRPLRRLGGRGALRGRERDRGHRRTQHSEDSRLRGRARSEDRAAPLGRLPQSVAAPGRRRPARRRRQLGRGARGRALPLASRAARRSEAQRDPGQARHAARSASASAFSGSSGTEC